LSPIVTGALIAVTVCVFFVGLGKLALVGPDEPRYAEVAREMYVSGDYVSPRLAGCLWFEKPAGYYWLAAASYELLGVSEFSARLPSALSALATVLCLLWVVSKRIGRGAGLATALVLATSGLVIGYARAATPDMLLTASMCVAVVSGLSWIEGEGRSRYGPLVVCSTATGLAMLAKGLVGPFLAVAILVAFVFLRRRWRLVRLGELAIAVGVFAVVSATWYGPVTVRHGWSFVDEFFVKHHFQRYVTNAYGHPQPVYFFLFIAVAGVAPWTFFLLPATARLISSMRNRSSADALEVLAWIWVAVPLLFFSVSVSKLPGYLLPAFPGLAIIIGLEVARFRSGDESRLQWVAGGLTAVLLLTMAIVFAVYVRTEYAAVGGMSAVVVWIPSAVAVAAGIAFIKGFRRIAVAGAAAVVVALVLGAVALLFPWANDEWSLRSLSVKAAAEMRPGEKAAFFIMKEYVPAFYIEGRIVCQENHGGILNALSSAELADAVRREGSLMVFTEERWLPELESEPRFQIGFTARQGEAVVCRVSSKK
jgi:4-amino-4-deoxy-L-arabinose transferase-like glycosyltransferase